MPDETAITETKRTDVRESDASTRGLSIDQMVEDSKTLSEDVTEWLRLKIQLIQIEVQERITDEVNALLTSVLVLGILMIAMLLGLMALALYIGLILGEEAYGFAIIAAFVAILGILVGRSQPQWIGRAMNTLVPRRWLPSRRKRDDKPAGS